MVILSIADMHMDLTAENKLNGMFRLSLDNFIKTLRELYWKDGSWKPDFICICGDIINRGKTDIFSQEEARSAIVDIARAVGVEKRHVMMVPGNHDLIRGKEEDKAEYVDKLEQWLEGKRTMPKEAEDAFTPYASFRKSFLEDGKSDLNAGLATGILPKGLADAVGCRIFEKEKIVFVELNSSWRDVGKVKMKEKDSDGNAIIRPREILFHRDYVRRVSDSIQALRARGFYVVTLFHHSLRFISPDQYVADGRSNVYDNIINMSNICLSGHEHGSFSKVPDKLGNKCQYILNGGFFSMSVHNQIIDSGATLIRIDRHKELLCTRRLARRADNSWTVEDTCNIYSTADRHINPFEKLRESTALPNALDVRGLEPEERQPEAIIRKLFGAGRYAFSEIKPSLKGVRRFEVQRGIEAGAGATAHVVILSAGEFDLKEFRAVAEPGCVSVVVYKYSKDAPDCSQEYSRLKSELAAGILSGKIILTPAIG